MGEKKISWLSWNKASFDKALNEKKPVLLDIHGVWCHWCHVMDKTTYSNEQVIDFVNQNFIPIKVDTDKRPDVNERYNAGGWPTTAILTPKGSVIQAATYVAPEQMIIFLKSSINYFRTNEKELDLNLQKTLQEKTSKTMLLNTQDLVENVVLEAKSSYDQSFGGFGFEPKFPMPDVLSFLEFYYLHSKDTQVEEILKKTLTSMAKNGLFDTEEFGFFRYSTTRDWSIPHFEKMLEDNALLLSVYVDAAKLFGDEIFSGTAKKIIDYLLNNFFDEKEKMFYASQDADEKYYSLSLNERKKLVSPAIDRTFFVDLNCIAAGSFLKAYSLFGEEKYKVIGLDCLKKIYEKKIVDSRVLHYENDLEKVNGFLSDYTLLINASLNAYFYSQDKFFLEKAVAVSEVCKKKFFDDTQKVFFDVEQNNEVGFLQQRKANPKLNSLMSLNLALLNDLQPNDELVNMSGSLNLFSAGKSIEMGIFGAFSAKTVLILENLIGLKTSLLEFQNKDFLKKIFYNDFGNIVFTLDESAPKGSFLACWNNRCYPPIKVVNGLGLYEQLK